MKAYLIAEIEITDSEVYEGYRSRTREIIQRHGGRFLVRGGRIVPLEGRLDFSRVIVAEFPNLATAQAFYDSDAYQEIIPIRTGASNSRLYFVEGAEDGGVTP